VTTGEQMTIRPGSRWKSAVCGAEAVLVRVPAGPGVPQCGGHDMVPLGQPVAAQAALPGFDTGCRLGKRYRDEASGIELLCTAPGTGGLGFGGRLLALVETRQLPSSD